MIYGGIHLRELIVDAFFKAFKTEVKKRGCLFADFLLDLKLFCVVIKHLGMDILVLF